ncbi:hypothetical protein [Clostridium hydrogeniformans]|uniref:hypothetical protein n=1 Tax=Clostridium hydrogeniformans TaxID=349933 RepID=UPI000485397D|nr:hypothetical protein [Clostridium hydrogeniformans]
MININLKIEVENHKEVARKHGSFGFLPEAMIKSKVEEKIKEAIVTALEKTIVEELSNNGVTASMKIE